MITLSSFNNTVGDDESKRIMRFSFLALVVFVVGSMPLDAIAGQYGNYTYISDGTNITITGYTGTDNTVDIPESIEALPVTTIGPYAFDSYTNLTDLVIPNSIRSIEYNAFKDCSNLINLTLQEGMDGIDNPAFGGCHSLRTVTFPASVVNASPISFSICKNLTNYSFNASNPAYSSLDGVWFSKDQSVIIGYPYGVSGSYNVPETVTTIGGSAFNHCTLLESVTIPESVTNIQSGAFAYSGVYGLTIPQNVSFIGEYAFHGCRQLSRIAFLGDEPEEPYFPQWLFYETMVQAIYYRAGTSWNHSYADIPTVRCTATIPELIPHPWILSDFPGLVTDEDYELAAAADQDGDGMPSWEEYVAGTSRTNIYDYFSISYISNPGIISWPSVSNRFYSVFISTNIITAWPEVPVSRVHGSNSPGTYSNDLFGGRSFYRVEVEFYR